MKQTWLWFNTFAMVDKMTEKYFYFTKHRQDNWPVKTNFLYIKMMKWITRQRKKFWFYDICLCFISNYQLHTQTVSRNALWIRYVGLPSPAYDSIFGRVRERIFLKWTTFSYHDQSNWQKIESPHHVGEWRWDAATDIAELKIWSWDQTRR